MSILFRALGIAYALAMIAAAFFFAKDRFQLHDWLADYTPITSLASFAVMAFLLGALRSWSLLVSRFSGRWMLLPLSVGAAYAWLALHAAGSGFAVLYSEELWLAIGYPLALATSGALWLVNSFQNASATQAAAPAPQMPRRRQSLVTSRGSEFDFAA